MSNLTGRCRGPSESTLVKMSNCWKSHAAAQLKTSLLALLMYVALNGAQYYPDFCELVSRHVLFFVTEIKLDHTDVISVDGYIIEPVHEISNNMAY